MTTANTRPATVGSRLRHIPHRRPFAFARCCANTHRHRARTAAAGAAGRPRTPETQQPLAASAGASRTRVDLTRTRPARSMWLQKRIDRRPRPEPGLCYTRRLRGQGLGLPRRAAAWVLPVRWRSRESSGRTHPILSNPNVVVDARMKPNWLHSAEWISARACTACSNSLSDGSRSVPSSMSRKTAARSSRT
jgi:hypothetical protein